MIVRFICSKYISYLYNIMPTIINPDIAQERLNCKLDLDEITNIFYYGKENNSRRKRIGLNN